MTTGQAAGFGGALSFLGTLSSGFAAAKSMGSPASLFAESRLHGLAAGMYMRGANAYSSSAKAMVAVGKGNARQERLKGAMVDRIEQANLDEAIRERRQFVGSAKVAFAANGVLLEGRDGAAVAMWERDEVADLAYQQLVIMQDAEDTIWGFLMSANQREAEGYGAAANAYGQAAGAAASAYSSHMNAYAKWNEGLDLKRAQKRAKRRAWIDAGLSAANTAGFIALLA